MVANDDWASISWSKIEETDAIQLAGEKAGRIFPRVPNLRQGVDPERSRELAGSD
jgi:hypothetical protein